jgi:hypothetical protein
LNKRNKGRKTDWRRVDTCGRKETREKYRINKKINI